MGKGKRQIAILLVFCMCALVCAAMFAAPVAAKAALIPENQLEFNEEPIGTPQGEPEEEPANEPAAEIPAPEVTGEETGTVTAVLNSNVREGPSEDYDILYKAYEGEAFEYLGKQDEWYFVQIDETRQGYIHEDRVNVELQTVEPAQTPEAPTEDPEKAPEQTPAATASPSAAAEQTGEPEASQTPLPSDENEAEPSAGGVEAFFSMILDALKNFFSTWYNIVIVVVVAVVIILAAMLSRLGKNVELIQYSDGRQKLHKRLKVKPERNLFIDISEYIFCEGVLEVRVKNEVIHESMTPIFIQIGSSIIEANVLPASGEDYSATIIKIDLRPSRIDNG